MTALPDIARRLSRQIEQGKGIRIDADDLDVLVDIGFNELVQRAAAEYLRDQCRSRAARSQSINGGLTGSNGTGRLTEVSAPPSSPSNGTIDPQAADEALQRARRMSRKGRRR